MEGFWEELMSAVILKDEWKLVKAENQRQKVEKDWGGAEMERVLGRRKVYVRNGGLRTEARGVLEEEGDGSVCLRCRMWGVRKGQGGEESQIL